MKYTEIYKCFNEFNRLRILNLLIEGSLCVCHIHEILEEPQPKVSRLLNNLKEHGGVESVRHFNWTIYRIPMEPHPVLLANLKCLFDQRKEDPRLRKDLEMRDRIIRSLARQKKDCPLQPEDAGSGMTVFCNSTNRLFDDEKA